MLNFLLFVLLAVFSTSFVHADCHAVPECLSGLCLRGSLSNLPTEKQVDRLFGSGGQAMPSIPHRKTSCHLISTPKYKEIYVKSKFINVESKWHLITITMASQKLCDDPESFVVDFELLTEKNIGLDSRQEDIIAAYGNPRYLITSPSEDLLESYFPNAQQHAVNAVLQYVSDGDDLLTTRFFLSKDLVVGIDLSADE